MPISGISSVITTVTIVVATYLFLNLLSNVQKEIAGVTRHCAKMHSTNSVGNENKLLKKDWNNK